MARGVTTTEYMILLAVVLVIILVAAGMLLDLGSVFAESKYKHSDTYWRNDANPIAIPEHGKAPGVFTGVLQNTGKDWINITGIKLDGNLIALEGGIRLAPGSRKTINFAPGLGDPLLPCPPGTYYEYDVIIEYEDSQGTPHIQTGLVPIYGQCTELPPECQECGEIACCSPYVCGGEECTKCGNSICDEPCDECLPSPNDCCTEVCQFCNEMTGTCGTLPPAGQPCSPDALCCGEGVQCDAGICANPNCYVDEQPCGDASECCHGGCEAKGGSGLVCCSLGGCTSSGQCCGDLLICNSISHSCAACPASPGAGCGNDEDCCKGTTQMFCNSFGDCSLCPTSEGTSCQTNDDCCRYDSPYYRCFQDSCYLCSSILGKDCSGYEGECNYACPGMVCSGGLCAYPTSACGVEGDQCGGTMPDCCEGVSCNPSSWLCEGGTPDIAVSLTGPPTCYLGEQITLTVTARNIGAGIFNRNNLGYYVRILAVDGESEVQKESFAAYDVIHPFMSQSWERAVDCPPLSGSPTATFRADVDYENWVIDEGPGGKANNRDDWNVMPDCKLPGMECTVGGVDECCEDSMCVEGENGAACVLLSCGNGACDAGESCGNCPQDCNPESCFGSECCPGYRCDGNYQCVECRIETQTCGVGQVCCPGQGCIGGFCAPIECGVDGDSCTSSDECCEGYGCKNEECAMCTAGGEYCGGESAPCCSGYYCEGTGDNRLCGSCGAEGATCEGDAECCWESTGRSCINYGGSNKCLPTPDITAFRNTPVDAFGLGIPEMFGVITSNTGYDHAYNLVTRVSTPSEGITFNSATSVNIEIPEIAPQVPLLDTSITVLCTTPGTKTITITADAGKNVDEWGAGEGNNVVEYQITCNCRIIGATCTYGEYQNQCCEGTCSNHNYCCIAEDTGPCSTGSACCSGTCSSAGICICTAPGDDCSYGDQCCDAVCCDGTCCSGECTVDGICVA